jgi:LysM repeat protein
MRSDVKIGIICAFVLLLGVVGYFAWSTPNPKRAQAKPESTPVAEPAQVVGSVGTTVAPPGSSDNTAANSTGVTNNDGVASTGSDTSAPGLEKQVAAGSPLSERTPGVTVSNGGAAGTTGSTGATGTTSGVTTGTTGGTSTVGSTGTTGPIASGHTIGGTSWPHENSTGAAPGWTTETGATAGTPIPTATTNYTVVSGDTIWSIAKKFKVTRASLMAANNLNEQSKLSIKQVLKIPAPATSSTPGSVTPPAPSTPRTGAAVGSAAPAAPATPSAKTYKVKANDDLRKIAKSVYGDDSKWSKIYAANKTAIGENPNILKSGIVLKIPA